MTTQNAQAEDESAPMGAEMQALMMEAGEIDGDAHASSAAGMLEAHEETAVMGQTEENARSVRLILAMVVPILSAPFPSLVDIYTDHQCDLVAASLAPVMTKYGINLGGMSDRPEIAALLVCGPLAFSTYVAVKGDIAARNPQLPKADASKVFGAPVVETVSSVG